MSKTFTIIALFFVVGLRSYSQDNYILHVDDFKHYIDEFNRNDNELYRQLIPNDAAWKFLKSKSQLASMAGEVKLSKEFTGKADSLQVLVNDSLWDANAGFYKTRSEKNGQLVDVRELQGYTPWYVNLPPHNKGYEKAWALIKTDTGFNAPYGLTTAEQSHPKFIISYLGHECQWNGPVWPFATSITLKANKSKIEKINLALE